MDCSAFLVILAALITLGSCCNSPYVEVGDKCLLFLSSLHLDYQSSEGICSDLEGKLIKIDHPRLLWDIVKHINNDSSLFNPYWIDGSLTEDRWIYSDGTEIPRGTPYWATFLNQNQQLEQQPEEHHNEDLCLAIEDGSSYYFSPGPCADLKSPLCEEITAAAAASPSMAAKDSCGGGELTAFTGEIMSPNYPGGYPDTNGYCRWTINRGGDPEAVIRITITDLDLSPPDQFHGELIIRDGPDNDSPVLGEYYYNHGADTPTPFTLVTSGPAAYIQFFSNHDVTGYRGFDLQYTTVCRSDWEDHSCGAVYNSPSGSIGSPCFPFSNYPSNLDCTWTIEVETDKFISLTVVSFDTQVDHDVLQIRDGIDINSPLISELSGNKETGYQVISTGNQLYITFTSDSSIPGPGFSLVWTSNELCPKPYLNIGQMCLQFILYPLTYGLSSIACEEASGQLAAINDPQDLRDVYLYLQDKGISDISYWIGGSDNNEEGIWRWEDNTLVPRGTPFWGTTGYDSEVQEPDGGGDQNCLLLSSSGFHFFRDANCTTEARAICMH